VSPPRLNLHYYTHPFPFPICSPTGLAPDRATWQQAHTLYLAAFRAPPTPTARKRLARLLNTKRPLREDVDAGLFEYEAFLRGLGRMSLSVLCSLCVYLSFFLPSLSLSPLNPPIRPRIPRWPLHLTRTPQPLLRPKPLRPTSRRAHGACPAHSPCTSGHRAGGGASGDICGPGGRGSGTEGEGASMGIWTVYVCEVYGGGRSGGRGCRWGKFGEGVESWVRGHVGLAAM
jgi:hypothetical protein